MIPNSQTTNTSINLIKQINSNLDDRINTIIHLNSKYRSILQCLESLETDNIIQHHTESQNQQHHTESKETYKESISSTSLSLPVELDSILSRAKDIRSHDKGSYKRKNTTKRVSKESSVVDKVKSPMKTTQVQGKSDDKETKLSSDRSTAMKSPHTNASSAAPEYQKSSSNTQIFAMQKQVKLLWGNKCAISPFLHTLPTKNLYLSQIHFLTLLSQHPSFPPSVVYRVVCRYISKIPGFISYNTNTKFRLHALAQCLSDVRQAYERSTQSKLRRVSVSDLTVAEGKYVFMWWYLCRVCIDVYEQVVLERARGSRRKGNGTKQFQFSNTRISSETDRLRYLIRDMVQRMPLQCHLPALSSVGCGHNSDCSCWLDHCLKRVGVHHSAMQSRVKYVVETIISKLMLRDVLRELKSCCAEVASGREDMSSAHCSSRSKNSDVDLLHWKDALRGLQAVETCLLHSAKRIGPTIFFRKE